MLKALYYLYSIKKYFYTLVQNNFGLYGVFSHNNCIVVSSIWILELRAWVFK